ncbi:protein archease [Halobacteriales archaeon QS_8_69_26]|nr:MAG: protein archease [Halobacteriales archaeon QS_8_69_26]
MSYELRDHTADVGIAATAGSLGGVMAALADGMAAAQCDEWPAVGDRFDVEVRAENPEALLFDYLDELIYRRDVLNVLPVDNEATVREAGGEWILEGSAMGVPLDRIHAREIKAVTYSEMRIEETDDEWEAYVVLDV